MKRMAQVAVLLSLVEQLDENHSWCGETHIQKATYLLKEMFGAELEYEFILYKHGPYSFDLSDELGRLRADGFVKVIPHDPYGPNILPGNNWQNLKTKFPKTINKYQKATTFLGSWLGSKRVSDLEKLATAFYVTKEDHVDPSVESRAERITDLKPHISYSEAEAALNEVDAKRNKSKSMLAA